MLRLLDLKVLIKLFKAVLWGVIGKLMAQEWRSSFWKTLHIKFLNTVPSFIDTLNKAVVEHMDPFFVAVGTCDLQKVVNSSNDIITTVKMATTELPLHHGEEVAVWRWQIRWKIWVLDEFKFRFLDDCAKATGVHFLRQSWLAIFNWPRQKYHKSY